MVGRFIKQLRKDKNISLRELSKKINTSSTYINEVENNHKIPSDKLIISLSKFFNVKIDSFPIIYKDNEIKITVYKSTLGFAQQAKLYRFIKDLNKE